MEQIELWKYRDRIWRRRERGLLFCILLGLGAIACVADPGIPARVAATLSPASPGGRRAAVYLLDRELDRALAAYRVEEAAHGYIAGNFESLGARGDSLGGEAIQREIYLEAMKTHILTLQADRRRRAVLAGLENRVDPQIDYFEELDSDGK